MSPIISLEQVSKEFGGSAGVRALDGVSLAIEPGEVFAVIGYSGAGKSTLVRLINGLEHPTTGTVSVEGTTLTGLPDRDIRPVRRRIGMVFQQFNLFNARTVYGNIAYPLKLAGWSKADQQARVTELLNFVGLVDKAWAYPDELSGGQKQRVGIARALATRPTILLADECTSALDPETTQDVLALLRRVNEEFGITIVVITHEMDVVRSIADRVAVLEGGRLVEVGEAAQVFASPATATARRFVSTIMRHHPEGAELERLVSEHPGKTLVSVGSTDNARFGAALGDLARAGGVTFEIVHGGVVQVKTRSIGTYTVALSGEPDAVRAAAARLAALSEDAAEDTVEEVA